MDGLPLILVQDRILQLRLVSRQIMIALESNFYLSIKIRINAAGVENLTAGFLQRWNGRIHLECRHPWTPGSKWFTALRDAFWVSRRRPLGLLSLLVMGKDLHPLVETLVGIGTAIQQLEITYLGNGTELLAAAAAFANLSPALTMNIYLEGRDPGGSQMSLWWQHLVASSIRIKSISYRSVQKVTLPRPALQAPQHCQCNLVTPHAVFLATKLSLPHSILFSLPTLSTSFPESSDAP